MSADCRASSESTNCIGFGSPRSFINRGIILRRHQQRNGNHGFRGASDEGDERLPCLYDLLAKVGERRNCTASWPTYAGWHAGETTCVLQPRGRLLPPSCWTVPAMVTSSCLCKKVEGAVFPLVVLIQGTEDRKDDAIHAVNIDKTHHGTCPATNFQKSSLNRISEAQLSPQGLSTTTLSVY